MRQQTAMRILIIITSYKLNLFDDNDDDDYAILVISFLNYIQSKWPDEASSGDFVMRLT